MRVKEYTPNLELRLLIGATRRFPRVKGAGRVANWLRRFYLRKRRASVEVDVLGSRMRLDPAEAVDGGFLFHPQLYDYHEIDFMRRNLHEGGVFLDIGAHIGFYSLQASRMVGRSGRVLAFEADPHNWKRLSHNLQLNGIRNVDPLNVGVSDTEEVLSLVINSTGNRSGNTFLPITTGEQVEVQCYPLADLLKQNQICQVAGAKLDIEGFEYRVLNRFLADADPGLWPRFVITEHHPEWNRVAGGDVIEILKSKGYSMHWSSGLNYIMVKR